MTPKEYLMQYRKLSARLENIEKNLNQMKDERESLTISYDGMPKGTAISDKTARLATFIVDKENELLDTKYELVAMQREISKAIAKVENADYSRLLYMRYIDGLTWEEIAVNLHFTWRHVLRLHGRALQEVGKILGMS